MRGMVLGETRKPFTELRRGVAEYCVLAVLRDAESYAFDIVRVLAQAVMYGISAVRCVYREASV